MQTEDGSKPATIASKNSSDASKAIHVYQKLTENHYQNKTHQHKDSISSREAELAKNDCGGCVSYITNCPLSRVMGAASYNNSRRRAREKQQPLNREESGGSFTS
jgi:hypothetical protein